MENSNIYPKVTTGGKMTRREFIGKGGEIWEWDETPETLAAIKKLSESSAKVPPKVKFGGNYQGPLYAPHPSLKKRKK